VRALALLPLVLLLAASAASSPEARKVVLGRSLGGRPVVAYELGDPVATRKVLVVGCIHGDECAGIAIIDRLRRRGPPAGVDLWLVPDTNPDGRAAGARGNARGVDLNRNFPWRWRSLSGVYDSGAGPASERETRIAMELILRLRPRVTIWFHQHLNMVVLTAGNLGLQRRFARLTGQRAGRLPRYPGTATGWSNARLPGTTAFVVELPAGRLGPRALARFARAVREVAP
jgi:protein MpaA